MPIKRAPGGGERMVKFYTLKILTPSELDIWDRFRKAVVKRGLSYKTAIFWMMESYLNGSAMLQTAKQRCSICDNRDTRYKCSKCWEYMCLECLEKHMC